MDAMKTQQKTPPPTSTTISGCNFTGVQYDAKSTEAIQAVADAVRFNAEACASLAKVFDAQRITIQSMVSIGQGSSPVHVNSPLSFGEA
jgi:hypothetical protein